MYNLKYLSVFNNCGDQDLISYCMELEMNFRTWSKDEVTYYACRKILEGLSSVLHWNRGSSLADKINNNAKKENKAELMLLRRFGNCYSHNPDVITDRTDYNNTTKDQIFKMLCFYAGREFAKSMGITFNINSMDDIDTNKLPFYNIETGMIGDETDATLIRFNNDSLEHFIYRENNKTRYIVRRLTGTTLSRDNEVERKLRGTELVSKCITSEPLTFDSEQQIRVLALAPNQLTLEDYIKTNPQLGGKKAFELFYQLIKILQSLGNIQNGYETVRICHRNLTPQTVIIQQNGEKLTVILSCFDHAKISTRQTNNETVPFLQLNALNFPENPYFPPALRGRINKDGPTLTLGESQYADIYAAAKILSFMITKSHDLKKDFLGNKNQNKYISPRFKKEINSCLKFGSNTEMGSDDESFYTEDYVTSFYKIVEDEYTNIMKQTAKPKTTPHITTNKPTKTKQAKSKATDQKPSQDDVQKLMQERDAAVNKAEALQKERDAASNDANQLQDEVRGLKKNNFLLKIGFGVAVGLAAIILIISLFLLG